MGSSAAVIKLLENRGAVGPILWYHVGLLTLLKAGTGWGMLCIVLAPMLVAGEGDSYVEPDFSARIIDVDAISLEGEERAEVVAALATVAGAEETGNLVRMKAMAIALRLDSMHVAARQTNDLLIAGGPILPEGEGGRRLSEAVALLDGTATRLRDERNEKEDAELYPYLMDIVAGARGKSAFTDDATLQGALHWELVLGGAAGEGSEKEGSVVDHPERTGDPAGGEPGGVIPDAAGTPESMEPAPVPQKAEVASPGKPAATPGEPIPAEKIPPMVFKGREAALRVVVFEESAEGGERAVACRIAVEVSEEGPPDGATPFHCSEGIGSEAAEQLKVVARLLQRRHSTSSPKNRIDMELVSLEDGRRLPLEDARIGVPALFLFDALLTGATLDEEISVGGAFPTATGKIAPRGRWGAIVAASGRSGAAAVVVSRSAEADLTDGMIAGDLESLLRTQVIELSGAEEVGVFLTGSRDANVVEAMRLFEEVQDLAGRHDLTDLMANLKVQERLSEIVNLMPIHLSAKLLLECGKGRLPQRMSLRGSLLQIGETVEPVRDLGKTADKTVVTSSLDDLCADSLFGLRRLRNSMAEGSLAYCDAAVDFVEHLREYLKISNRTTALAMQKAAEMEAARSRMENLRAGFEAALEAP